MFAPHTPRPLLHHWPRWPWPTDPKIKKGHLHAKTTHYRYVKFHDAWSKGSQYIDLKPNICRRPTDQPTDRHLQNNIPSFFQRVGEGGIKINLENNFMITVILVVMCRVSSVCRITCADPEAWTLTSQDVAKHNISQKPARTWSLPLYPSHTPAPLCAAMRICAVRNYTNYCHR